MLKIWTFSTFDSWQRAKDCVLLHDEEGFDIIKEDYRISQSIEPDACIETKDIPGMIRIINAEKALQLFANHHQSIRKTFVCTMIRISQ